MRKSLSCGRNVCRLFDDVDDRVYDQIRCLSKKELRFELHAVVGLPVMQKSQGKISVRQESLEQAEEEVDDEA